MALSTCLSWIHTTLIHNRHHKEWISSAHVRTEAYFRAKEQSKGVRLNASPFVFSSIQPWLDALPHKTEALPREKSELDQPKDGENDSVR